MLALSHVLIDSSVKKKCKSFSKMSLTVPTAEWLERHVGKQGVAGSTPGGNMYFHFEVFAFFPFLTARRKAYK